MNLNKKQPFWKKLTLKNVKKQNLRQKTKKNFKNKQSKCWKVKINNFKKF